LVQWNSVTLVINGRDLDRQQLVRVARGGEPVALDQAVAARMMESNAIVKTALGDGRSVYGLSTAVGVLKRVEVGPDAAADYSQRMIRQHAVAQGPEAPAELVRGTILRLANAFAEGSTGVRPLLAERLIAALNEPGVPSIRTLGSIGQADLAPMANLAVALFSDLTLEAGEGLALVSSNAFSTAAAALAVAEAERLLDTMDVAGALGLEAIAARPTMLHQAIGRVRPYPGLQQALARLGVLLEGSALWEPATPRNLQDPLTFRNLPQVQGACRDVLDHVDRQLVIELNASQSNPIVLPEEGAVISVANFEILPLAVALDYLRIVLATALSSASERTVKLLQAPWSGLPTGLTPTGGTSDPGLGYFGIATQALAAEARLLAQPVSFEIVSTTHAEGIEDRMTMAPLAARRVAEMVALGDRIVALELAVAAQAAELRGLRLGRGTAAAVSAVRTVVPFLDDGDTVPDIEPLVALVRRGVLAESAGAEAASADSGAFESAVATPGATDRLHSVDPSAAPIG
jgi:histidine ammonia-lyase